MNNRHFGSTTLFLFYYIVFISSILARPIVFGCFCWWYRTLIELVLRHGNTFSSLWSFLQSHRASLFSYSSNMIASSIGYRFERYACSRSRQNVTIRYQSVRLRIYHLYNIRFLLLEVATFNVYVYHNGEKP